MQNFKTKADANNASAQSKEKEIRGFLERKPGKEL